MFFGQRFMQVDFNQLLEVNPACALANWFMVWGGFSWRATSCQASSRFVNMRVAVGIPVPGVNRVSYLATPPDVKALDDGAEALPFLDFPM